MYCCYVSSVFCVLFQYLSQRKKLEAEEKRVKQKIAREDFRIMLEVSGIFFCECLSFDISECVRGWYISLVQKNN